MAERRWTIWSCGTTCGIEGPLTTIDMNRAEKVEVMAVSEHREKVERLEKERASLHGELATLLGPRTPRKGVTANDHWIAAVGQVLASRDALLADLRGEVESLRKQAAEGLLKTPHGLGVLADRLQALIDKHTPSSEPSTEEGAAKAAAPERSSESGD